MKKHNKENNKKEDEIPSAAPRTLSDIFRISNTNRKKNKLRKKTTKFADSNSSRQETDAPPPANISQLIKMQYKQDGVGANGWNKIQSMNDSEFISHLGWLESDKKSSPP